MNNGLGAYNELFVHRSIDKDKLLPFGFGEEEGTYVYSTFIVDGQFRLVVRLSEQGEVAAQLFDTDTQDEYILHLTGAEGVFIGKVRTEFAAVLQDIADKCFSVCVFKSEGAAQVIRYVREKYHDELEFLWEKFPDNAIVRRKDNKKWYAAVLTVRKNKLGLVGEGTIEILDLRMKPEDIAAAVDGQTYFPGYHMNKRSWVSLLLDGSVPAEELYSRIDDSYLLAKK